PQISSEGNNVYVVWQDDDTPDNDDIFDIFFARSTDGGLTFSGPDNISETTGNSRSAQISVEGNNVYVVWLDETPGNNEIFFARSTDGGLTFTDPENISENTETSGSPQISSEGNNVYVVWIDASPNLVQFDIFFATSSDGGLTFSEPENISENTGSSINPQISSNTELQQQSTNDIITTTANNNNDQTVIKNMIEQKEQQKQIEEEKQNIQTNNIIQPKDVSTKDTTNKNILEQKEEQKLAEEQKIQKSNVMSPPSLP
ncbi:MAG TPA: sialidase family protein, partial [Nitrososphaeraceae archaeon]|nr:sialidase family protein [Nitrososphaeraceae archaeon]